MVLGSKTKTAEEEATTIAPPWNRSLLFGASLSAFVALFLVALTWIVSGRSFAERSATDLVLPVGAAWSLLLMCSGYAFHQKSRRAALAFLLAWISVGITFNSRISGAWVRAIEYPADSNPLESFDDPLRSVVLLGGYAGLNRMSFPEVGSDGQRLVSTAQIWHAGKAKAIICTGTAPKQHGDPSSIGKAMLISLGVPEDVIFEVKGDNTLGEMRGLKAFFRDPPEQWLERVGTTPETSADQPTVGLVTSAFHMPRALRLAEANDLEFLPLPCRFSGAREGSFTPRALIPNVGGGKSFAIAMKESLARFIGR